MEESISSCELCPDSDGGEWCPLCGSNGQSYADNCDFKPAKECEGVTKVSDGMCEGKLKIFLQTGYRRCLLVPL